MVKIFFEFLSYNLISLLIILFVGKLVASCFNIKTKNSKFLDIFIELSIGLLVIVLFSSLIATKGSTVFIFVIPLIVYLCYLNQVNLIKPSLNLSFTTSLFSNFLISILVIFPFFLLEFVFLVDHYEFHFITPYYDLRFYADLSSSLFEFGRENKSFHLNKMFPTQNSGVIPYHYFELWLNGFFSMLFKTSPIKTLMLITYPLLKAGVFIGVLSLISIKQSIKLKQIIFAVLLIFIAGIYLPFFDDYLLTKYHSSITQSGIFAFQRKLLPLYFVGIVSLCFFFKNNYKSSIISILFFAIFSIGTAPAMLSLSFLCALYLIYKTKIYQIAIFIFLFSISLFVFFYVFSPSDPTNIELFDYLVPKLINEPFDILILKSLIFKFVFPFIRIIICYGPYPLFLAILVLRFKKINKPELKTFFIIAFLICVLGSIFSTLMTGHMDASQLLYNNLPFFNCILISVFIVLFQYKETIKWIFIFLGVTSIFNFYNTYYLITSHEYPSEKNHAVKFKKECIKELELNGRKEIVGFSLNDWTYSFGGLNAIYQRNFGFLQLSAQGAYPCDINPFRFKKIGENFSKVDINFAENYEIFKFKKLNKLELSEQDLQLKFISDYNIHYLYIQNNSVISDSLINKLKIKKTIVDKNTGDEFLILK
jgi:hypothetical protein